MILEAANKYYTKLHSDLLAIQHYIKHNVAVFITLLYLLGSIAGVVYLATLLSNFSVDVFQHIELSDFLLALLSHPKLVLFFILFIFTIGAACAIEVSRIPDPKKPTLLKKLYHALSYPLFLLNPTYSIATVCLLFLCLIPYYEANRFSQVLKNKNTQVYALSLNDSIQQGKINVLPEIQIVASTSRNLFVYDNKKAQLLIIPQNNVAAIIPIIKNGLNANTANTKPILETKAEPTPEL